MTNLQEKYFLALRAGLWDRSSSFMRSMSLDELCLLANYARSQGTAGIVAHAALKDVSTCDEATRLKFYSRFASISLTLERDHAALNKVLLDVYRKILGLGTLPVLLKGQGIAAHYPVPTMRQCGDIDIYVPEADFERAWDFLFESATPEERASSICRQMEHNISIGGQWVELHRYCGILEGRRRNAVFQQIASRGLRTGLREVNIEWETVLTPEDSFNAYFIFYHFNRHFFSEGIGFRQLCDWAVLLHSCRSTIDRERLHQILEDTGSLRRWQIFGVIAVDYLGLPADDFPFYDPAFRSKGARLLRRIFADGNFGRARKRFAHRPSGRFKGKLHTAAKIISRCISIAPVFPRESARAVFSLLRHGTANLFH